MTPSAAAFSHRPAPAVAAGCRLIGSAAGGGKAARRAGRQQSHSTGLKPASSGRRRHRIRRHRIRRHRIRRHRIRRYRIRRYRIRRHRSRRLPRRPPSPLRRPQVVAGSSRRASRANGRRPVSLGMQGIFARARPSLADCPPSSHRPISGSRRTECEHTGFARRRQPGRRESNAPAASSARSAAATMAAPAAGRSAAGRGRGCVLGC